MKTPTLPYGIHKGKTFDKVPRSYLEFVARDDAIRLLIEARKFLGVPPIPVDDPEGKAKKLREIAARCNFR